VDTTAAGSSRTSPGGLRWELVGVVGAMLAFFGFSLHYALTTQPFFHPDEHAHLSYGYEVASGHLPEIETPDEPPESATWMQERIANAKDDRYRTVWVANHPPLYYLFLAPLLEVSEHLDMTNVGGVMSARLLNIGFATAAIGLVYLLAVEITGGAKRIGVAAAALVALLAQPQYTFSHGYNDGLGFLTITLVLLAATRVLCRGPSSGGTTFLAFAVAAAAATRASGLVIGVGAIAVVALSEHGPLRATTRARARQTVTRSWGLLAPTVVLVGWFYVRNLVLYGDIGASSYLLRRFSRGSRQESVLHVIFNCEEWRQVYDRLVGHVFFLNPVRLTWGQIGLWRWGAVLAVVGLALAWRAGTTGDRRPDGTPGQLARPGLVLLGIALALNGMLFVQHVAGGGSAWPRYLYTTLGASAILVVIGLDRLLPRLLPFLAVVGAAASSWTLTQAVGLSGQLGAPWTSPDLRLAALRAAELGVGLVCAMLIHPTVAAAMARVAESRPDDHDRDRDPHGEHLRQVRLEEPHRAQAHGGILRMSRRAAASVGALVGSRGWRR
jgi:hypothetical protein